MRDDKIRDSGALGGFVRRLLESTTPSFGEIPMRFKGPGRTCDPVAAEIDIPIGTIKRKLDEALERVRGDYDEQGSCA